MNPKDVDLSYLSSRDQGYVRSPSFETHMIAGFVFAACFTLSFMIPAWIGLAWLFFPGIFVSTAISLYVMRLIQHREFFAKLREVEADPRSDDDTRPR